MADIKLDIKYRMDLSREEWLVVSKALRVIAEGGRCPNVILTAAEEEIAEKLQEQMLVQKHNVLSQMTEEAAKPVANLKRGKP